MKRPILEQKAKGIIGMAQRAGLLVSGSFAVTQALKEKKVSCIIITEDAERKTKEMYRKLADMQQLPCILLFKKDTLGKCIGKEYRSVAALLDDGFSKKMQNLFMEWNREGNEYSPEN